MQIAVSAPRKRSPSDISIVSQDPGLSSLEELTAIKIPPGHPPISFIPLSFDVLISNGGQICSQVSGIIEMHLEKKREKWGSLKFV